MPEKLTEFDAAEYINTDERARLYLEVAADEDPGDGSLIRAAINDIARAQNMSRLAVMPIWIGPVSTRPSPRTATLPSQQ